MAICFEHTIRLTGSINHNLDFLIDGHSQKFFVVIVSNGRFCVYNRKNCRFSEPLKGIEHFYCQSKIGLFLLLPGQVELELTGCNRLPSERIVGLIHKMMGSTIDDCNPASMIPADGQVRHEVRKQQVQLIHRNSL